MKHTFWLGILAGLCLSAFAWAADEQKPAVGSASASIAEAAPVDEGLVEWIPPRRTRPSNRPRIGWASIAARCPNCSGSI